MNNAAPPKHILLVGCGNMGSALLRGWGFSNLNFECTVIDPGHKAPSELQKRPSEFQKESPELQKRPPELQKESPELHPSPSNSASNSNPNSNSASASAPPSPSPQPRYVKSQKECIDFITKSDAIILAVKPQIMEAVCESLKPHIPKTALILSIAAGQSINTFENYFSADQPIVRTMPNTPAMIGKGITVATANPHVSAEQKELATTLLNSAGQVEWVEDEALLNAVTALSGSGPAYVFYLIETLTKAGEKIGLPAGLAGKLARQTVIGSAALAEYTPETSASTLRENVTSPGGTTEAALKVLMNGELDELFERALSAAKQRSEELS